MSDGPKILQDLFAAMKDSIAADAHTNEMSLQVRHAFQPVCTHMRRVSTEPLTP